MLHLPKLILTIDGPMVCKGGAPGAKVVAPDGGVVGLHTYQKLMMQHSVWAPCAAGWLML